MTSAGTMCVSEFFFALKITKSFFYLKKGVNFAVFMIKLKVKRTQVFSAYGSGSSSFPFAVIL